MEFFFKGETASQKGFAWGCSFLTSRLSSLSQDLFLAVALLVLQVKLVVIWFFFLRSSVLTVCEFEHFVIYISQIH